MSTTQVAYTDLQCKWLSINYVHGYIGKEGCKKKAQDKHAETKTWKQTAFQFELHNGRIGKAE